MTNANSYLKPNKALLTPPDSTDLRDSLTRKGKWRRADRPLSPGMESSSPPELGRDACKQAKVEAASAGTLTSGGASMTARSPPLPTGRSPAAAV